jgi:hypothetical protein
LRGLSDGKVCTNSYKAKSSMDRERKTARITQALLKQCSTPINGDNVLVLPKALDPPFQPFLKGRGPQRSTCGAFLQITSLSLD